MGFPNFPSDVLEQLMKALALEVCIQVIIKGLWSIENKGTVRDWLKKISLIHL